jgi:hypothetical protein
MKRLLKILKITALSILGLIVLIIAGLLIFYHSIYKTTPPPSDINVAINFPAAQKSVKPVLLPLPKKIAWTGSQFELFKTISFQSPVDDANFIAKIFRIHLKMTAEPRPGSPVQFKKNASLGSQAYTLSVQHNRIQIEYNDSAALFYALTTLKQIISQSGNFLPCVQIEDKPDMMVRGALLDISRGKIPTLGTLYSMVDFLADLKYNQLQLYIEGFSFAYPSFKNLWEKTETPLTPEEIRELDVYCKDREIELVPNQNSLGHMNAWLATNEFKDLAECPEGYKLLGLVDMKSTLAPSNPKSLELVKKMSGDLLPNFSSRQFNVDLDEPFELGKCKEHPVNDPREIAKIYLKYAKQLNDYVNSQGRTMMMWGDVLMNNPGIISEIPKNVTLLEWGYESAYPFDKYCERNQKSGLKYMVCPGTSSWSSFTGRTDIMIANVDNAIGNGIRYGAAGMLMTDWGDSPHLQYLTVSYAGFAYAAALSWNFESKEKLMLGDYLSRFVFKDSTGIMGDLVLQAGRYYQYEEYPMISMTTTAMVYMYGMADKTIQQAISKKMSGAIGDLIPDEGFRSSLKNGFDHPKEYNAPAIISLSDTLQNLLDRVHLNLPDSALILDEYKNGLRMVRLGALAKQYNLYHLQQTDSVNRGQLEEMKLLCQKILGEHQRLWMIRNKKSGLEQSMDNIHKLQTQVDKQLDLLNKNFIARWLNRTGEKLTAAAAVLYLR